MFNTKIITRELKSIPFDICNQIYNEAAQDAESVYLAAARERYESFLAQKEQEWNDTHEAPYEGNFSDEYPFSYNKAELQRVRVKAGQAAIVDTFIPRYKLDTIMQTWVMSQIISYIARGPFNKKDYLEALRDEHYDAMQSMEVAFDNESEEAAALEGLRKIDPLKILNRVFGKKPDDWNMGLYRFLMLDSRSCYLKTQYKGEGKQYCALVPLIMYAFKLHHGVKYSEWSKHNLQYVVNRSLYEAMTCEHPGEFISRDDILKAREQGLLYKSGAKAGEGRNPETTFKLYDTTGTKLHGMPDLAKTMLAQIWCAHPSNRTRYMVLDPWDWDRMPVPLIGKDIFTPMNDFSTVQVQQAVDSDYPWELV